MTIAFLFFGSNRQFEILINDFMQFSLKRADSFRYRGLLWIIYVVAGTEYAFLLSFWLRLSLRISFGINGEIFRCFADLAGSIRRGSRNEWVLGKSFMLWECSFESKIEGGWSFRADIGCHEENS